MERVLPGFRLDVRGGAVPVRLHHGDRLLLHRRDKRRLSDAQSALGVLIFVLRVALIVQPCNGCVRTSDLAWGLGDIGVGLMAWLNIFAILVLQKPALLALKDYGAAGQGRLEPQFDPRARHRECRPVGEDRRSQEARRLIGRGGRRPRVQDPPADTGL